MSTQVSRELYFWFDCETSGLDPNRDTVLEVAWCFTDEHLRLISPLRQRFTKIMARATGRDGRRAADQRSRILDPTDESSWHDNSYISPVARQMHEESGLRAAWFDTCEANLRSILTHPRDLFRLVAEDLNLIGATNQDRLVLAGAGVSHFDDSVLAEAFDGLYPRRPVIDGGTSALASWHYRCFDTSVALFVCGPGARAAVEAVAAKLAVPPNVASDEEVLPFDLVECESRVDPEVSHVVAASANGFMQFDRNKLVTHRAADDVVWSLLDARALRYWIGRGSL